MKKRGLASRNFRRDSGRRWDAKTEDNQSSAPKARARMIAGVHAQREGVAQQSLTDEVVNDFMGGRNAAEKQAKAYQEVIDNFKNGNRAREPLGSLAEAARNRMIERREQNTQGAEKYPDIGQDRANRRAYPAEGGRNV